MSQKILRDDIEYLIHSDDQGNIIGPISRNHAHMDGIRSTLTHHSTWSMVYHLESGRYGIQLKNPKKHDKYGAGKWDMGVAGHNHYFNDNGIFRPLGFDENLIIEAKGEIGIDVKMFKSKDEFFRNIDNISYSRGFIFEEFLYKNEVDNEWVGLGFIIVPNMNVKFEDDEVLDFKWLLPKELENYLETNDDYCSPLPLAFKKAEKFRKENRG